MAMPPPPDPADRRPLKSRSTRWANATARWLAARNVNPNAISAASIAAAAAACLALLAATRGWLPPPAAWLAAAVLTQARLAANLLDGMVALAGGRRSVTGGLWNELPDRFADTLLLVAAGVAAGVAWLGAAAAWAAVMAAYVRAFGASLTGRQDFCGPMAKPQRMAVLTGGCVLAALEPWWSPLGWAMPAALGVVAAGGLVTVARRIFRLARHLRTCTE